MLETLHDLLRCNPLVFTQDLPSLDLSNRVRCSQLMCLENVNQKTLMKRMLDLEDNINQKNLLKRLADLEEIISSKKGKWEENHS